MDNLLPVRRLLAESSDPDNPSAETLADLLRTVRHIAVIGLSRDPTKVARRVPSYLAAKGYDVTPVNPYAERILGRDAFATLSDVSEPVDLVVIFRPSDQAGEFVESAAARVERPAIWLQEGIRADEPAATARADGLVVVQDLCSYKVHRTLT